MAEWIYRATEETADRPTTLESLTRHAFLCRTAYRPQNILGIWQLVANVRRVSFGDVIHVAFSWDNAGTTAYDALGSFVVLDTLHPDHDDYVNDANNGQLTLFKVRPKGPLEAWLDGTTYERDPRLNVYTGWHVKEIEGPKIRFNAGMFPNQGALHPWKGGASHEASPGRLKHSRSPAKKHATPSKREESLAEQPARVPTARRTVRLPDSGSSLGVDWSGARDAGSKVWAARITFGGAPRATLDAVWQPFGRGLGAAGVAEQFIEWLNNESFNVAGLDFCFGVSRQHAPAGMPITGPSAVGQWLAENYATPEEFKLALGPELKRETDHFRNSPFAPSNLRMYRQTYWGLRALAGLTDPVPPWDQPNGRAVVEVLPAHVVSVLCAPCSYKGRDQDSRTQRERLLGVVRTACRLNVAAGDEEIILGDTNGDAMDAVLAAVAAASARDAGFAGVPAGVFGTPEGWIFSIT